MKISEKIYREYVLREEGSFHAPYNPEMEFYNTVKLGDLEGVKKFIKIPLCKKEGLGELSDNGLRNFKYHFVITAAMLSRYCIDGGMLHEEAYSLSDMYIREADTIKDEDILSELHCRMVEDYTKRMNQLRTANVYSKVIVKTIDYIYSHLHERILIEDVAVQLGISREYLSRLFKREIGESFSEYVQQKKIETATNMILYSEYSDVEISNILAFPSQSYFVKVFKKYEGVTPGKYRRQRIESTGATKEE